MTMTLNFELSLDMDICVDVKNTNLFDKGAHLIKIRNSKFDEC